MAMPEGKNKGNQMKKERANERENLYYLTDDWEPTTKENAELIKIVTYKNGYREESFFKKEFEMDTLKVWIALQDRDKAAFNVIKRTKEEMENFLLLEYLHSDLEYYERVAEVIIEYDDPFSLVDQVLKEGVLKDEHLGKSYNLYSVVYEDDEVILRKVRDEK